MQPAVFARFQTLSLLTTRSVYQTASDSHCCTENGSMETLLDLQTNQPNTGLNLTYFHIFSLN